MRPEEYYESQNALDNYEIQTSIWDNVFVPDDLPEGIIDDHE